MAYGNRVFICVFLFSALGLLLYILLSTCTQWAKWSISSVVDLQNDTCSYLRLNQNISSLVCYLLVWPTMEIDRHKDLYWNQNKNHFSRFELWDGSWQEMLLNAISAVLFISFLICTQPSFKYYYNETWNSSSQTEVTLTG